jgi:hypothetical protein
MDTKRLMRRLNVLRKADPGGVDPMDAAKAWSESLWVVAERGKPIHLGVSWIEAPLAVGQNVRRLAVAGVWSVRIGEWCVRWNRGAVR